MRKLCSILCVLVTLVTLVACGGGGGTSGGTNSSSVDVTENRAETSTAVIGSTGGTVTLSSGAVLTIPAGALTSNTSVTFSRLANSAQFGSADTMVYEMPPIAGGVGRTLRINYDKGLSVDDITVVSYTDPFPDNGDDFPAAMPDFTYDPATGVLTITIEPPAAGVVLKAAVLASTGETLRVAVEKAVKDLSTKTSVPTIRIPYYQQVGPSCWAADVAMLAKAYGKPQKIHELLKALGRSDASTGWGLGPTSFNNPMRPKVEAETGLALKYELYWSQENLKNRIIALLDQGYPVMLGLPTRVLALAGGHSVVFVGYDKTGTGDSAVYTFTLMDSKGQVPANSLDGGMYVARTWEWFELWFVDVTLLPGTGGAPIVWIEEVPPADGTLATLGVPSGGFSVGNLSFSTYSPDDTGIMVDLTYKPATGAKGLAWASGNIAYTDIPNSAKDLEINLPVWNSGASSFSGNVVIDVMDGSKRITGVTLPVTAAAQQNPTYVAGKIAVKDFRGVDDLAIMNPPAKPMTIKVTMDDGSGKTADGFSADFSLQGGPRITLISPTPAKVGEPVTITGRNFGKLRPAVRVYFGDIPAEPDSVTDTTIEVTVPAGAVTGDVFVLIGSETDGMVSNSLELTVAGEFKPGLVKNVAFFITPDTPMYGLDIETGQLDDGYALVGDPITLYLKPQFTPPTGETVTSNLPVEYEIYLDDALIKSGTLTMEPAADYKTAYTTADVNIGTLTKGTHTIKLVLDPGLKLTDPLAPDKDTDRIISKSISVSDSLL